MYAERKNLSRQQVKRQLTVRRQEPGNEQGMGDSVGNSNVLEVDCDAHAILQVW